MPFKIVVIDDHPLIHEAVTNQFNQDPDEFELAATGVSGEEIELLVEQHRPDVLLLDIGLPAQSGSTIRQSGRYRVLPALKRVHEKYPETHIIILSSDADRQLVHAAIDAGAEGYLVKDDDLSLHLPDAIRAIANGGVYFSTEVARLLSSAPRPAPVSLTERQIEILHEVRANANLTSAEHARNLGISEDTYRKHLSVIFEKLGALNLTYAVVRAMELGILPLDTVPAPNRDEEEAESKMEAG